MTDRLIFTALLLSTFPHLADGFGSLQYLRSGGTGGSVPTTGGVVGAAPAIGPVTSTVTPGLAWNQGGLSSRWGYGLWGRVLEGWAGVC